MACATVKVSQKIAVSRIAASIAASRGSEVPHPAPIKPLPYGKPFELVVVGNNRLRRSTGPHSSDGKSSLQTLRPLKSVRRDQSLLNSRHMNANLKRTQVLVASRRTKFPTNSSQTLSLLPPHFVDTRLAVPYWVHTIKTSKPVLFTSSKASTNQVKPSPVTSSSEKQPTNGHPSNDPNLPNAEQLSFILLKLREELPTFFSGHHSYCIYSPNLLFRNRLFSFQWSMHGRRKYQWFMRSTKGLLWCMYSNLNVDVLRITKDPCEGKVEARWRITGRPRISAKERVIVDVFSIFVVNSEGLISQHKMERIISSKSEKIIRNFIRKRLESLEPAKQTSFTQSDSN